MEQLNTAPFDESLVQCTKTIMQLISYLNIPDVLLADMYDNSVDSSSVDDLSDEIDVENILTCEIPDSLQYVLKAIYNVSTNDINQQDPSPTYSMSVVFHNLITLFLRLLCTKDEELSVLRNRPMEKVCTSINRDTFTFKNESDKLRSAHMRINDLLLANTQQADFYNHLVTVMNKKLPITQQPFLQPVTLDETNMSSSTKEVVEDENSTVNYKDEIQRLQIEIDTLRRSLQTTGEDVTILENSNSRLNESIFIIEEKESCIASLREELRTVNPYVKKTKEFQLQANKDRETYTTKIKELRKLVQQHEYDLAEKDKVIEALKQQLTDLNTQLDNDSLNDSLTEEINLDKEDDSMLNVITPITEQSTELIQEEFVESSIQDKTQINSREITLEENNTRDEESSLYENINSESEDINKEESVINQNNEDNTVLEDNIRKNENDQKKEESTKCVAENEVKSCIHEEKVDTETCDLDSNGKSRQSIHFSELKQNNDEESSLNATICSHDNDANHGPLDSEVTSTDDALSETDYDSAFFSPSNDIKEMNPSLLSSQSNLPISAELPNDYTSIVKSSLALSSNVRYSNTVPLVTSVTSASMYIAVIGQLHKEILQLKRQNDELITTLQKQEKDDEMMNMKNKEVIVSEDSKNEDMMVIVNRLQKNMKLLEETIREKNDIIYQQNLMLLNKEKEEEEMRDKRDEEVEKDGRDEEVEEDVKDMKEEEEEERGDGKNEEKKEKDVRDDEEKGKEENGKEKKEKEREEEKENGEIVDQEVQDLQQNVMRDDDNKNYEEEKKKEEDVINANKVKSIENDLLRQLKEEKTIVTTLKEEYEHIAQKLDEEIKSNIQLNEEKQALQSKNKELEEEIAISSQTNTNLKQEKILLITKLSNQKQQYNDQIQILKTQQDVVATQLQKIKNNHLSFRDFVSKQYIEYALAAQTTLSSLSSKFEILNTKLQQYHNRIASLSDEVQNYKGNYRVMIRVRPLNHLDTMKSYCVHFNDEYEISINSGNVKTGPKLFTFDRVFPPSASQDTVFSEVRPVIESIFRGINACIMAYGQTGAGKTYTMNGEKGHEGIVPRCCNLIFDEIEFRQESEFIVKISICELYNEVIRDLLNKGKEVNIQTYGGNYLSQIQVHTKEDVKKLVKEGIAIRTTSSTKMNISSSRSHMLVFFYLYNTKNELISKLTLVDLAGSENLKQSNATNKQMKEAQKINLSLFELTNVLRDLNIPNKVVSYRNSKLTTILKDTLGGKTKNLILVHLNPTERDYSASLNSLKLAEKITTIKVGDVHAIIKPRRSTESSSYNALFTYHV